MIRITVRTDDAGMACNVGGSVQTTYRSFLIACPELEAFLVQPEKEKWGYTIRQVISYEHGVEEHTQ